MNTCEYLLLHNAKCREFRYTPARYREKSGSEADIVKTDAKDPGTDMAALAFGHRVQSF
jgi:hypothetical protein